MFVKTKINEKEAWVGQFFLKIRSSLPISLKQNSATNNLWLWHPSSINQNFGVNNLWPWQNVTKWLCRIGPIARHKNVPNWL